VGDLAILDIENRRKRDCSEDVHDHLSFGCTGLNKVLILL
jgi:hypothetical protein